MAFASIYVPNFIVQAVVCAEPELRGRAVALLDGTPPLCSVVTMNEFAMQNGIQMGMSESQAAQFCGVEKRRRSSAREEAAHAALLDMSWSISPRVEDTTPDTIVLDLTGLHSFFGADTNIAKELARRASQLGLNINIGISANIEVAIRVARGFSGITLVPSGEESASLVSLPVSVLSPSVEIMESLERWGVRTCADLSALPAPELSERLGQEGVHLRELARGASKRSLVLAEPNTCFAEEIELDDAVEDLEPLAFLLGRLLDQLCARLQTHALAAAAIHLRFDLGDAFESDLPVSTKTSTGEIAPKSYERDLRLPVPMRDSKMLLKLLRLQLQADPPQASIRKISMAAEPARRRATQKDFFRPNSIDPEKLELTIARLGNLVGSANVGTPQVMDTHRSGTFRMSRFSPTHEKSQHHRKTGHTTATQVHENRCAEDKTMFGRTVGRTTVALRIFRPEWLAKIDVCEERPLQICFRGLRGKIAAASGPWRSSGDWWREDAWRHEEWDIHIRFHSDASRMNRDDPENTHDGLYRIYYDYARRNWYVRGRYD
jgi:protein ImuB